MIKLLQPIVNRRYAVLFTWHPLGSTRSEEWLLASGAAGSRLAPHHCSESWGGIRP